ncbi:nucleotidyltransferase domain-containing protein [Caedibacter taeniospiralis]|jgi:predicted nucleotidyltransferase|uniref:nucleotidyltransferase domain-containing protein n=1 Tax=Caedibacter taeniospiralis TaxID=28907 RepID=UPI0037C0EAC5
MLLRDKDRELLIALAVKTLKTPCEIWAYGSRVDGSAHDGSDLDLVIRTKNLAPLNALMLQAFKDAIQTSNIPILVQVLDWARIPQSFHSNILKNYAVLKPLNS